jgi:hypothetical protein
MSGATEEGDDVAAMEDGHAVEEEQGRDIGGWVRGSGHQLGCHGGSNGSDQREGDSGVRCSDDGDGGAPTNFSSMMA